LDSPLVLTEFLDVFRHIGGKKIRSALSRRQDGFECRVRYQARSITMGGAMLSQ